MTGVTLGNLRSGYISHVMDICLSMKLPEDVAHLPMVRRVSREVLTSFGATIQDVDDIEVLVGELATNAIRHAKAHTYEIEIALSDNLAVITVRDYGVGFAREQVLAPGTPRVDQEGEERIGGWGLPLVELLADRVEFFPNEPYGTTVRAEKRLQ